VVVENPLACQGQIDISKISKILRSDYWAEVKEDKSLYRPLTIFFHAAICHVAGVNPFAHHLVSVVLHATCTLLVLFFLRRLLVSRLQPLLGALLFAIHPTYSEAVLMVSNRSEIVQTCACLGVLIMAHRFVFKMQSFGVQSLYRSFLPVLGIMFVQALGIFSKENAAVAPILVAIYLGMRLTKEKASSAQVTRYLIAITSSALVVLIFIVVRMQVLGTLVRTEAFSFLDNPIANQEMTVRLCTAVRVLGRYITLFFLPLDISGDYSFAQVPPVYSLLDQEFLKSLLVVFLLVLLGPLCIKKRPLIFFGIMWFFVCIFPVSNIPFPIGTIMALRLCYLPYIGLIIALSEGLAAIWHKMTPLLKNLATAVVAGYVLFFGLATFSYAYKLRTNCDFFKETVRRSPRSAKALYGFGVCALYENDLGRAIQAFDRSLKIYPNYTDAVIQLAQALETAGRLEDAIAHLRGFIAQHPDDIRAKLSLGKMLARNGRFLEARAVFLGILDSHPGQADAKEYLRRLHQWLQK